MAGALVALILGLFAVRYLVDQVIVGVVLNVLVVGLTSFLFRGAARPTPTRSIRRALPHDRDPAAQEIPMIGPVLFRQNVLVYLMYAVVALVYVGMFRSRWGLRMRAVGEHPKAADTVGIKVNRTRVRNTMLGGAIAGLGGAFFTVASGDRASAREMSGGEGFIALAAMILGRWGPIGAMLAALLFGFASNLQGVPRLIGSPVPSQFMLMLPYLVTIFAVAGLVGSPGHRPPTASPTRSSEPTRRAGPPEPAGRRFVVV